MVAKLLPFAIFLVSMVLVLAGRANEEPQLCTPVPVYLHVGDRLVPDGNGGFVVQTPALVSTPVETVTYSVMYKR